MFDVKKIINVKFSRKGKGYDTDEVDAFLDELAEEISTDQQTYEKKIFELVSQQQTIVDTLVSAQTFAQNIEEDARKKSDAIISESLEKAEREITEKEAKLNTLKSQIEKMQEFFDEYRDGIVKDMENQLECFKTNFFSDSIYEVCSEKSGIKDLLRADKDENETSADASTVPELNTENIDSINLNEIITGVPKSEKELKALIDEIM